MQMTMSKAVCFVKIRRTVGIRQGDPLTRLLFNIAPEKVIQDS